MAASQSSDAHWYRNATRWSQLTWVEDDPGRYDPDFWLDVFKRTKSNAVCLSAGGYVAYYPSKVPYHYVSKYLGSADTFGTLVAGARHLGMKVMARVDPHAIHDDAANAHPEWVMLDRDGKPRRHWAYPQVWVTCAYSSYNFEFMPQVIAELTRDYDIDAIFANRWQGHGICYCSACRTNFTSASGFDLPADIDAEDPASQAWTLWRREILTRLVVEWDDLMKSIKPHTTFIPNLGAQSLSEFDPALIEKHCPFLCVDDQARRGTEPVWMAGRNGKRMRGTFPNLTPMLIASIGPEEYHRWKDSVTTGAELQAWIDSGTVQGLSPWFTKFNGVVPDRRWVEPVVSSFVLHADLEPHLAGTSVVADIALIDPATTVGYHGYEARRTVEGHDLGFYQALIEARLPFEMLSDQRLSPDLLDRFKLVILPNTVCLSDAQAKMLEDYVGRGGSVIAGFETGMRTERNHPRQASPLESLLGYRRTGATLGSLRNTYVTTTADHALTRGYDGAERIIGGTAIVPVEALAGATAPIRHVPRFPDLPMEEVYVRSEATEPAAICREHASGGRTIYVPWNLGSIFWEVLQRDHAVLIENCVRWALGHHAQIEVDGDAVVDICVRTDTERTVVLLQNLTNPMMMKGPIRSVLPVGKQTISIPVPPGRSPASAHLLVAGIEADFKLIDGRVRVSVPGIDRVEAVDLRWTQS